MGFFSRKSSGKAGSLTKRMNIVEQEVKANEQVVKSWSERLRSGTQENTGGAIQFYDDDGNANFGSHSSYQTL